MTDRWPGHSELRLAAIGLGCIGRSQASRAGAGVRGLSLRAPR